MTRFLKFNNHYAWLVDMGFNETLELCGVVKSRNLVVDFYYDRDDNLVYEIYAA